MSERNKLLSVLVVGLLVGFGVGRLVPQRADEADIQTDRGTPAVAEIEEGVAASEAVVETEETAAVDAVAETGSQLVASVVGGITGSSIDRLQVEKAGYGVIALSQSASTEAVVASVAVTGSTWITIHADRDGVPGNVLGARRVEQNASGITVPLLRAMEAGKTYYVLLQEDNGNGRYDLYSDPEIVGVGGSLVYSSFIAQ